MSIRLLFVFFVLTVASSASADVRYFINEKGQQDWVFDPDYKDPALHITEEDMKGMVHVSPEQKRKMDEKIFKEALENEITARMYQDRVATREQAIKDILSGVPRKVR